MRFANKVVLITGGARGQGAEEARRFASEGAKVVITDVLDDVGQATAAAIGKACTYLHLDVSNSAQWGAVLSTVAEKFGRLDVLVNNAGIYKPSLISATNEDLLDAMLKINQKGTILGIKSVTDLMTKSGGGSIINISSIAGLRGFPNAIGYTGTKWAVRGMTKTAAAELAPYNIRVNSVHPGFIATDMLSENTAEVNKAGADMAPLKRHGTSADIAAAVTFLCADEASFITGAELAVDGGWAL